MNESAEAKQRARWAVKYALKTGRLIKGPCADGPDDCTGPIEAHHTDYARPLFVGWLCRRHHLKVEGGIRKRPRAPAAYVGGPIQYDPTTAPSRAGMLERLRQFYLRRAIARPKMQLILQPSGRIRSKPERPRVALPSRASCNMLHTNHLRSTGENK